MIKLIDITKQYKINKNDSVTALENISFHLKEGEVVVLKGASGSGKSTILSLIAAITKPTHGEVIVDSKHISKLPDKFASSFRQEHIGFIFQKYNLIPNLSAKQNITVPLIPSNPNEKELEKKLDVVMKKFHIQNKQDIQVQNLSGGEQQRVAIARSIINDPKIIIADEPTANLDEKLSLDFIEILRDLKDNNKTIIVATHDPLFFDLDFVDRIIEMKNGKIVQS